MTWFSSLGLSVFPTQAEQFGINFLGNTTAAVSQNAGVVPITNWNNIANATFTSGTIHSSDGAVLATLTMSGPGRVNGYNNNSAADGGNGSLMRGYNDAGRDAAVTNLIGGLTNASYTVYIYTEGDTARPNDGGAMLPNYTVMGVTYYTAAMGGTFSGYVPGGSCFGQREYLPAGADFRQLPGNRQRGSGGRGDKDLRQL